MIIIAVINNLLTVFFTTFPCPIWLVVSHYTSSIVGIVVWWIIVLQKQIQNTVNT
jgi:hypothetical protein